MGHLEPMAKKRATKGKKNTRANGSNTPVVNKEVLLGTCEEVGACEWPEVFIPWRSAVFMASAAGILAVIVFGAAALGGFTAVKMVFASLLGATEPGQISPSNYDMAMILWGIASVVLAAVIHPSLGVGLILLARSWQDGYTFPLDNIYFSWSIYLICAVWLVRVIGGKAEMRLPVPAFLFAGTVLWIFVTLPFSDQYYNTYLLSWLWLGYGFLFLLVLNTTGNMRVSGVLMTFFLVAMGAQALFSVLHFEYLLPYLREYVQNPAVLRQFFKTDVMSAEMARRFMVNRAFGTMLFPNALAAYLIMGIPFTVFMIGPYGRCCLDAFKTSGVGQKKETLSTRERFLMMGLASLMGIVVILTIYFVTYFPKVYVYQGAMTPLPLYLRPVPQAVLSLAAGGITGMAGLYLLMHWGLQKSWVVFRFAGMVLLLPLLVYTLWITYSRGALLALVAALVWGGIVCLLKPGTIRRALSRRSARSAALFLLFGIAGVGLTVALIGSGMPAMGWADETAVNGAALPPSGPGMSSGAQINQEGINLSMTDLADPASFRLRLGYWLVTFRMALDNWLTGIGIGNFAIAYPRYQHIGAGDVREAHNGFLQFFAETGLVGGLVFTSFWVFLGLWGAWRIINEGDKNEKRFLLGVYTGLIAFSMHAFLDINFSHPSLMMYAMAFCGLFYARAMKGPAAVAEAEPRLRGKPHRILAFSFIVILLVAVYGGGRIYLQQLALNGMRFLNLSCEDELDQRLRAGHFFFNEVAQYGIARSQGKQPKQLPRIPLPTARLILDDLEVLSKGCTFYKPLPESRGRFGRLEEGDPIPPNALVVVRKPWMMRRAAGESALNWVRELEYQDRRFPHSPELAMHLAKWYEFYAQCFVGPAYAEQRPEWIRNYLYWSETMLNRNPKHADMRMIHANTLMWKLLEAPEGDEEDLLREAEKHFQEMLRLSPILPRHRYAYAGVLKRLAEYFQEKGQNERATEYQSRAQELQREGDDLQERRKEMHLY